MYITEVDNQLEDGLFERLISGMDAADREAFASNPWGTDALRASAANDYDLLLAAADEATGSVKGYGLSRCLGSAEVLRIAVLPAERRKGTGSRLLKRMMEHAASKGADVMYLEVRSLNSAAIAMYEKAGFLAAGTRKAYYHDPADDAVIMTAGLNR